MTENLDVVSGTSLSSGGLFVALDAALEAAGADIDALKNQETTVVAEVDETIVDSTTDVVIVGGGGAGLAAAVSAHQNGAKVILIEKTPRIGGNTIISGAAYNAADPERQAMLEMTDNEEETIETILIEEQEDSLVQEWQATLQLEWESYLTSGEHSYSIHRHCINYKLIIVVKKRSPLLISQLGDQAYESIEWLEGLGMEYNDYIFTVLGGL